MTKHEATPRVTGEIECNYSNNYYGDQVCVLKKQ